MLCRLSVQNYALIEELEFEPGPGFNIITGETGAGKSILLELWGLFLEIGPICRHYAITHKNVLWKALSK